MGRIASTTARSTGRRAGTSNPPRACAENGGMTAGRPGLGDCRKTLRAGAYCARTCCRAAAREPARLPRGVRSIWDTVIMAQARLARRHAGRAVRSDTLLSTVKSIQRGDFPTRRAAAVRAVDPAPCVRRSCRPGGLRPAAHVPRRRLRLMRLPNLTKRHVHPCHYGAVVHPA